ncbi:hypothetical protein I5S53_08480 [Pseudomonas juntendi]|uniref:hypothetical protein n=1 Tax=Pseudomonas TaxID=286 RepID=UPI000D8A2AF9|nr:MULTISPECIES: hypothetical protein [Pseudomonas]MBH3384008.1 hypothetical protein [Pseudomonas juntendi]PYC04921.1 hypothetical protein DMX12_08590 [Pseudomonas sp. MB-090624]TCT98773.1 hypothetical protein EC913_104244 [Pseudomonas sp. LP_4_YM]
MDVKWEPLVVHNNGLGVLRGRVTEDGKLLVENTLEAKLSGFMPGRLRPIGDVLRNPENALIVAGPKAFAGEWLCAGQDNENATPSTHAAFIFFRKEG